MPPSRRPHPPRAFHSVKVTPPIPRLPPRQHRTHSSRHSGFAAARPRVVDERCYIIRRGGGSEYVSRASVPLSDFEAEGCAARGGQPVLSPLSHRSTSRSRLGGAARVAACATRPRPPFPHHQSGLRLNRVGGSKTKLQSPSEGVHTLDAGPSGGRGCFTGTTLPVSRNWWPCGRRRATRPGTSVCPFAAAASP